MTVAFDGCVARPGWALRVDGLEIGEGVTTIVGANGSGKTTLGRAVAGLDRRAVVDVAALGLVLAFAIFSFVKKSDRLKVVSLVFWKP